MIKRRLIIELHVDGTQEQALCLEKALADALEPVVTNHATALCHSESINAKWSIFSQKCIPSEAMEFNNKKQQK